MSYESDVAGMVAQGIPREKAELRARELYPDVAAQLDAHAVRRAGVLEKAEQQEVRKVLLAHGCHVYSLSQPRATKQSPGLPDLFVFAPAFTSAFWFEVKRADGGVQSAAQREFQDLCRQCGIRYVIGGRSEAWTTLSELGLAP